MHVYDHNSIGHTPGIYHKTPKILLACIAAFLALALVFARVWQAEGAEQPEDVPQQLQRAIDTNDWSAAKPHLDTQALVGGFINDSLDELNQAAMEGDFKVSGPLAFALASLNSGNAATKQAGITFLSTEINKFTHYGVESGAFSGKMRPDSEIQKLDGGLFLQYGKISRERKEFGPASLVSRNGDTAIVKTSLKDYHNGQVYPLRLEMQEKDGVWKAVKVLNAADLVKLFM